jgi:hypothetical protein
MKNPKVICPPKPAIPQTTDLNVSKMDEISNNEPRK